MISNVPPELVGLALAFHASVTTVRMLPLYVACRAEIRKNLRRQAHEDQGLEPCPSGAERPPFDGRTQAGAVGAAFSRLERPYL